MNRTAKIKKDLISKIERTEDPDLLLAIENLITSSSQSPIKLNSEQLDSIEKGRKDLKEGNQASNDEVLTELKRWLKE